MNETIRRARHKAGGTFRSVASDLKVPLATFAAWEYARCLPRPSRLIELARYFQVSIESVVRGYEEGRA